jgi:hypothetical protein
MPSQPTSLRSSSVLCTHLCIDVSTGLFSVTYQKHIYFCTPHICHMPPCPSTRLVMIFVVPAVHNVLWFCFVRALSGWLFLLLAAYCAWRLETCDVTSKDRRRSRCVVVVQLIMLPTAMWNLVSTAQSINDKQGLLLINQIVSWSMLGECADYELTCDLRVLQQWSSGSWHCRVL